MSEIKLYKSPKKSIRLLLLSSAFVIPSIYLLIIGEKMETIFWICTSLFWFSFFLSIFNMIDRRVQIVLSVIGIWDRSLNQNIIPWENIKNAYKIDIHRQIFIALETDENFVAKKKLYSWAKFLNTLVGAQQINLNISYIKVDELKLIKFIYLMKNESLDYREKILMQYKDEFLR